MTCVINFPVRSEAAEKKAKSTCLSEFLPDLLPRTKADICARWKRGVRIRFLASEYRLTVAQVEAVIWEPQRNMTPPTAPAQPSIMQSRSLHVVSRRIAA